LSRKTLNLGILAHVDAGKTTLTERLLYAAGVIDAMGSVDKGTTQTDSLALERQRGITIKTAVASFAIGDVSVNLIDTPGHPDFIAEVERVLDVLDGAVLVVSAVEGVQPQTRILMRALRRMRVPTLLFVNKIDRAGADYTRVLEAIAERLTPAIVPLGSVKEIGTRAATFEPYDDDDPAFAARVTALLADHDDAILAAYVNDELTVTGGRLRKMLAEQTARELAHPVIFGSALNGAGVGPLMDAIVDLLPPASGDPNASPSGTVFKIDRGVAGDRIAYVRMFFGTLRARERITFSNGTEGKATAISLFDRGEVPRRAEISAGQLGKVWGLGEVRIGDAIGAERARRGSDFRFAPPTLETVVNPVDARKRARLRVALGQLAEQDPLINVRLDHGQEICLSLYGDVQTQVIQATLADDFGIDVVFTEVSPLYVERPLGSGDALEVLHAETNPYSADIGLRIDPAPPGAGNEFRMGIDTRQVPLFIYKTIGNFVDHMRGYVDDTLATGRYGWQVIDCVVTLTTCVHVVADGPPSRRGPTSTAGDFRKLTPIVLREALDAARTVVCEPVVRVNLEVPTDSVGALTRALAGASVQTTVQGKLSYLVANIPAVKAHLIQRQLPELTGGEGVLESSFQGYAPVTGPPPLRRSAVRSGAAAS
jgi:ribosomal protection tetracycline resistance protein